MAEVDPAGLERQPIVDARANAEFRLEQDARPESDAVGDDEVLGRSVVDREPNGGPDVETVAELPRQAGGGIARVALRIDRAEDVGLQPQLREQLAPAIADLEIRP